MAAEAGMRLGWGQVWLHPISIPLFAQHIDAARDKASCMAGYHGVVMASSSALLLSLNLRFQLMYSLNGSIHISLEVYHGCTVLGLL